MGHKAALHRQDVAFDQFLQTAADSHAQPSYLPRSVYMLRQVLINRTSAAYEHHVCVKDHHCFGYLPPSAWRSHQHDVCPVPGCGERRFDTEGSTINARKRFFYFGLDNTIQRLFNNPAFCNLRGKGRGPYFQSEEFDRLNTATGCMAQDSEQSLLVELGVDWFQPFVFRNHSTGAVFLR